MTTSIKRAALLHDLAVAATAFIVTLGSGLAATNVSGDKAALVALIVAAATAAAKALVRTLIVGVVDHTK